jgi:hypothetical protein
VFFGLRRPELRRHCHIRLSDLVEMHPQLLQLPLQPAEHGLAWGRCARQRGLLTGLRPSPVIGVCCG